MAPSNGWGGTMAMGCEVDNWMRHLSRWGPTPDGRLTAIWFCAKYDQFEVLRRELLEPKCFGALAKFGSSRFGSPQYQWPDGSTLHVGSYEGDFKQFEGVEPDLLIFDEPPPRALWSTQMVRLRTAKPHSGRVICKATQILGWTWMADEIYVPWLNFHRKMGLDEEQAMIEQRMEFLWCWPRGSIYDNPYLTAEYRRFLQGQFFGSPREKRVRLFGGFESFASDPVFDEAAIEEARARVGLVQPVIENGSFCVLTEDEVNAIEVESQRWRDGLPEAAVF